MQCQDNMLRNRRSPKVIYLEHTPVLLCMKPYHLKIKLIKKSMDKLILSPTVHKMKFYLSPICFNTVEFTSM